MIRFKVIRASHLLLGAAICLLVVALALLGTRLYNARRQSPPASGTANLVEGTINDEARTALVFASSDDAAGLSLDPGDRDIEIEVVDAPAEEKAEPVRILIYHTHTHEAYEQVVEDPYEALEAWRTTDADHSVVRVGEELAENLRRYGLEVVHDTTDHEGDQLSTAYTRSLETLQSYEERFDLYIDLHRDAYVEGEEMIHTGLGGEDMAPLMMLIGNGNGFEEKPWYEQNYAFALALEERINQLEPGLCKPVLVKDGRYNQNIGVFSILVEVGHNRNTLRQALNAVPPLTEAIYGLLVKSPDPGLVHMKEAWTREHSA